MPILKPGWLTNGEMFLPEVNTAKVNEPKKTIQNVGINIFRNNVAEEEILRILLFLFHIRNYSFRNYYTYFVKNV